MGVLLCFHIYVGLDHFWGVQNLEFQISFFFFFFFGGGGGGGGGRGQENEKFLGYEDFVGIFFFWGGGGGSS